MANAYKCDSCGTYYDKNEIELTGGNCENETFSSISIYGNNNWYKSYDLCDDCVKKLLKFLNDKKGSER